MTPKPFLDITIPNDARLYDYWLGGKDNFAADRDAAERQERAVPQLPWLARENRRFLGRAARFCAAAGVTQFVDIGTGLPTTENTHEVAGKVIPGPRVAYLDNDPLVVRHAQALLAAPGTVALHGDLTRPEDFLGCQEIRQVIDFSRPVALLMTAVLHYVTDVDDPYAGVARLREALSPGSYLVISHIEVRSGLRAGEPENDAALELGAARAGLPSPPARTREQIAAFFGGLTLVEPGLTEIWDWRPDTPPHPAPGSLLTFIGGVGRKDGR